MIAEIHIDVGIIIINCIMFKIGITCTSTSTDKYKYKLTHIIAMISSFSPCDVLPRIIPEYTIIL